MKLRNTSPRNLQDRPEWPRTSERRFFGQVRLLDGAMRQGSGGRAHQKCASRRSEEPGGVRRQGPAQCSVHRKAPHGLSARVRRVANPVGVVAQCLLGHNFDLRYPQAFMGALSAENQNRRFLFKCPRWSFIKSSYNRHTHVIYTDYFLVKKPQESTWRWHACARLAVETMSVDAPAGSDLKLIVLAGQ